MAKKARMGRPPAGLRGEKISKAYQTVTIRVPRDVRATMTITAETLNRPLWRVLMESFQAYIGEGSVLDDDMRLRVRFARRQASAKVKRAASNRKGGT